MAKGMVDLTDNGSVFKKILHPGTGGVVPEGSIVRVHYNGYLEYSDEPYDSSRLRNKQQQFRLGNGNFYFKINRLIRVYVRMYRGRYVCA